RGYFQSVKYTIRRAGPGGPETVVLGPMSVKSEILRPHPGAALGLGTNRVFGVAWAGEEAVAAVEASPDGGRTWAPAELPGPRAPSPGARWACLGGGAARGDPPRPARGVPAGAPRRPAEPAPLRGGSLIHHSRPTRVQVGRARAPAPPAGDAATLLYDMNA